MAAKTLVKWKPGKTGVYAARILSGSDWEAIGFSGEDAAPVEFNRANRFTVPGESLTFAQMDYLRDDREFEILTDESPAEDSGSAVPAEDAAKVGDFVDGRSVDATVPSPGSDEVTWADGEEDGEDFSEPGTRSERV